MKLSEDNIEELEGFLRKALQSRGLPIPIKGHVLTPRFEELLSSNGILLVDMMYNFSKFADMMCNFSEFPEGFTPVSLGMEYYALIPDKLALKVLALGYLDLK